VILIPFTQGNKLLEYAKEHKDTSERAILFVDFDMVSYNLFLLEF